MSSTVLVGPKGKESVLGCGGMSEGCRVLLCRPLCVNSANNPSPIRSCRAAVLQGCRAAGPQCNYCQQQCLYQQQQQCLYFHQQGSAVLSSAVPKSRESVAGCGGMSEGCLGVCHLDGCPQPKHHSPISTPCKVTR
jgi:hypothetical protein